MSKALLITLAILLVLFLIVSPFLKDLLKDKRELAGKTLRDLFPFFFNTISGGLFEGQGEITEFPDDPNFVNMMSSDPYCQNMIVHFLYGAGTMTMELGYKYYQQELTFRHSARLRNASAFEQKDRANEFVELARKKIYDFKLSVVRPLGGDEIVKNIKIEHPFDSADPLQMLDDLYGDFTEEQKEALIYIGYMILCATGDPESEFTSNLTVLEQIRYFNVSWENCKSLYNNVGEAGIFKILNGIDKNILPIIEPFLTAMTISYTTMCPDERKKSKLYDCLIQIGVSKEDFDEVALKNKLLAEMFLK